MARGRGKYVFLLILLHLLGLAGLVLSTRDHFAFLGLGLLAYSFGLRHAFDVDHIAAIDSTVRKLMQERTESSGVGFYFALGHSTVVFLMALTTGFLGNWVHHSIPRFSLVGDIIGSLVSGLFLLLIGTMNLPALFNLARIFHRVRKQNGVQVNTESIDDVLMKRGFFFRFIGKQLNFISKSWHIYPVGFLFGLGFDTATEVSLLAMSGAIASTSGATAVEIITLPILFTAGMAMMDTLDGFFMTSSYQWSLNGSSAKLYYNLFLTVITVGTALGIGLLELGHVISEEVKLQGPLGNWLDRMSFGQLGFIMTGLFIIGAIIVYLVARRKTRTILS